MEQRIRFCTTPDGVRIAYATTGSGPPLVKAANWLSHLEYDRRSPVWRPWLRELSRDHTLVRYDERGCGLSDWEVEDFSFDGWVRDLETVVDAMGLERFPLMGLSQGGPVAVAYAVRHPDRVERLILYGAYARGWAKRPGAEPDSEEHRALIALTRRGWGRDLPAYRQVFTSLFVPDADEAQLQWFNELQRISTSPENAARFQEEFGRIDVTDLLPRVRVPTLVLHVRGDARIPFEEGRTLAAGIPDSRFVPLEGRNHILLEREPAWMRFLEEVRAFLGVEPGAPSGPPPAETAGEGGFLHRLEQRKVFQWSLAYLASAWLAVQVLSVAADPWGLSEPLVRGVQVLLVAGFPLAVVLAWYHGERGEQRVTGAELVIIALLLAITGTVVAVVLG